MLKRCGEKGDNGGFTLFENLGIVVAIILLILVAIPIAFNVIQDNRVQQNRDNAATARSAAMKQAIVEQEGSGYYQYVVDTQEVARISSAPESAAFTSEITDLSEWEKSGDYTVSGLLSGDLGKTVYPIWVIYLKDGEAIRYYGLLDS